MDCPYCGFEGGRMLVHNHLMEEHTDIITQDEEEPHLYTFECPECSMDREVYAGTGNEPPEVLEKFANEVYIMSFDQLLNHLESEHDY